MTERRPELVEFMKDVAGEFLRGVLTYDEHGFDVAYLREDLLEELSTNPSIQNDLPIIHDLALNEVRVPKEVDTFGEYHATVRVFENAVLIQFIESGSQGYGVSLDTEAASQLTSFIADCTKYLDRTGDGDRPG